MGRGLQSTKPREEAVSGSKPPRHRAAWPFLATVLAIAAIYSLLPLGTALELGGDEGYELTKGFLVSKGFPLYTQIWNDQPPVLTMLLSWAFRLFGPSILVARLLAAGFGLLLFGVFYLLVRERSGVWAATAAVFFLLASPGILHLSSSVALEVPTFSTAMLSAWFVFRWLREPRWTWLVASGAVMGLAMEIKLTAVMVVPAILTQIALGTKATGKQEGARFVPQAEPKKRLDAPHRTPTKLARPAFNNILLWGAFAIAVFSAIAALWGGGSLQSSWRSHTATERVPGLSSADDLRFDPVLLLYHPECLLGTLAALFLLGRQKRWSELAFPATMLLAGLAIHLVHRPWWPWYYLHLAVPMAWLSGTAVAEAFKGMSALLSAGKDHTGSPSKMKWVSIGLASALALALAEARLEGGIKQIRARPRASESPVLKEMKHYAPKTHWTYVQPVIYPFHAQLAVPPELAVVTLKRYWSGQITSQGIVEVCHRYKPEQILLWRDRVGREWKDLLSADYSLVYADTNQMLYVSKAIADN